MVQVIIAHCCTDFLFFFWTELWKTRTALAHIYFCSFCSKKKKKAAQLSGFQTSFRLPSASSLLASSSQVPSFSPHLFSPGQTEDHFVSLLLRERLQVGIKVSAIYSPHWCQWGQRRRHYLIVKHPSLSIFNPGKTGYVTTLMQPKCPEHSIRAELQSLQ